MQTTSRTHAVLRRPLPSVPAALLCEPAPGAGQSRTESTAAATLVLAGSTGGRAAADSLAGHIAAHGGTAVALPYFGTQGLPDSLHRIPVETVHDAAHALADLVPTARLALLGVSRGAELALLAAATAPTLLTGPVIAVAPSSVVWPGHTDTADIRPAWTLGGQVVPYAVPGHGTSGLPTTADGVRCTPMYEATLRQPELWAHAVIEVERITGSLLLVAGQDDGLWPAAEFVAIARHRRRVAGRDVDDRHLVLAGAGHGIGRPGAHPAPTARRHPVSGLTFDLGGSAEADAAAADAWWQLAARMLGLAP